MKRLLIIFLLPSLLYAQSNIITLAELYSRLDTIYPLVKNDAVYLEQFELAKKKIKANYYPTLDLNAQFTYQSDVTSLNIDFPPSFNIDLEDASKDQYKATLDIKQLLFDGGMTKSALELESINTNIDLKSNEVELYQLKFQLNDIYFAILKLQQTKNVLNVTISELTEQVAIIESGIKNGVLTRLTLYELEAELLKLQQSIIETDLQVSSFIDILNLLLDTNFSTKTEFQLPPETDFQNTTRPELQLFELNKTKLAASSGILKKGSYPILFAFGQLGYGRPGANMLSNEFDDFYMVGAKLTWNIWDWNKRKNDRQSIEKGMLLIDNKIELFNMSVERAVITENSKIEKIENVLKTDEEIIELRKKITKHSESEMKNGVIRATDYTTDLNKETIARINYEIHKIDLIQSKINYQTIKGI